LFCTVPIFIGTLFIRIFSCYRASDNSSSLKKREMHQRALSPTNVKIILDNTESLPPHIHDTRSNPKSPILPQFMPPITARRSANLSNIKPPVIKNKSWIKIMYLIHDLLFTGKLSLSVEFFAKNIVLFSFRRGVNTKV